MNDIIERIVEKEYTMLDQVNGLGGRASCQDHFSAFRLMRASQFLVWPEKICESYLADLTAAEAIGRNLLFEKYAFMMQTSLPEEFEKVCHMLPRFTREQVDRMEQIVKIQVIWAEEFAKHYPVCGGRGRLLHTRQDTPQDTSVETYMRGELATYSDSTVQLYDRFVKDCLAEKRNLTLEVRENQARLEGWKSLEEVERYYASREGA